MKYSQFFLVLSLVLSSVFADSGSGGGDDNENHRDLTPDATSGDEVSFTSVAKSGDPKSKLQFTFRVSDGEPEIRVKYSNTVDTEEFRVSFNYVIIFNDTNGDGFTTGETLSTLDIGKDIQFDNIQCAASTNSVGGTNYDCTVLAKDGSFKVASHLVSVPTTVNATTLRPTGVKIDVELNPTRPVGSSVALVAAVRTFTKEKQTEEDQSEENKQGLEDKPEKQVKFGTVGWFSWYTSALVGNTTVQVVNSPLEVDSDSDHPDSNRKRDDGGEHNKLVFSFVTKAQGLIVWDPKLSWAPAPVSSAISVNVSFFLIFAMLAIVKLF